MKKYSALFMALCLMLVSVGGCSSSSAAPVASNAPAAPAAPDASAAPVAPAASTAGEPLKIALSGSPATSSAYVISVAYGEIVNNNLDDVILTVEETSGGAEFMNLIQDGDVDCGNSSDVPAYQAYKGIGDFEGNPHDDCLRSWMPMYRSETHVVTLEGSDIHSIADLKGKRINIEQVGRGGELINREVLTLLGLYDQVKIYNVAMNEAMEMLKTGQIDAAFVGTAAPASPIVELGTTTPFRIVPFSDDELKTLSDARPYYFKGTIPGGTYSTIKDDVQTLVKYTSSYISTRLSDEVVYKMTKTIWEHKDRLIAAHPSQAKLDGDMVVRLGNVIPYHPGAEKYFKEQGYLK